MSQPNIKPIFLLADSQLLFWRDQKEGLLMERIYKLLAEDKPEGSHKAAYIGASNDDNPDYYDIFLAAVNQVGITADQCRLIRSKRTRKKDIKFLEQADLILLAGGDIEKGWKIIKKEFQQTVVDRYYNGAVLVGISAGAVQLGMRGWKEERPVLLDTLFETFQLVPAVIDVHNEESDWSDLAMMVEYLGGYNRGFGIPAGGGAVYHPDWSFEAIRHHLVEFSFVKGEQDREEYKRSLIIPGEPTEPAGPPPTPSPETLEALQQPGAPKITGIADTPPAAGKKKKKSTKKTGKTKKNAKKE
jgi:peptidase E